MSRNKREGYYCGVSSGQFERGWPVKKTSLYSFPLRCLNRKQRKYYQLYNGKRIKGEHNV